jgi:hypothetical protein
MRRSVRSSPAGRVYCGLRAGSGPFARAPSRLAVREGCPFRAAQRIVGALDANWTHNDWNSFEQRIQHREPRDRLLGLSVNALAKGGGKPGQPADGAGKLCSSNKRQDCDIALDLDDVTSSQPGPDVVIDVFQVPEGVGISQRVMEACEATLRSPSHPAGYCVLAAGALAGLGARTEGPGATANIL